MDKESIIELQKIDCNCNDCIYLVRDFDRFKKSVEDHHRWQLDHFNKINEKKLEAAADWERKANIPFLEFRKDEFLHKAQVLRNEVKNSRFQFNKSVCSINYGQCNKFNKPVSFLPNTIQLDTQTCFEHRRQL